METNIPTEQLHRIQQAYRASYLVAAFLKKKLTSSEESELDEWLQKDEWNMELFSRLTGGAIQKEFTDWQLNNEFNRPPDRSNFLERVELHWARQNVWNYVIGACLVIIMGSLFLYILDPLHQLPPQQVPPSSDTIPFIPPERIIRP